MKTTNLTVLRNDIEWSTRFDGDISSIEINGRKINDVHDLTERVVKMTKTIHYLAWTATALAIMAVASVIFLLSWLISHESSIERLLLTGNHDYDTMVEESKLWRSQKRQRAFFHLRDVQGLYWHNDKQDWMDPEMESLSEKPDRRT